MDITIWNFISRINNTLKLSICGYHILKFHQLNRYKHYALFVDIILSNLKSESIKQMTFPPNTLQILNCQVSAADNNFIARTKLALVAHFSSILFFKIYHITFIFYFETFSITQGLLCFNIQLLFIHCIMFLAHGTCAKHLRRPELPTFCDKISCCHIVSNMRSWNVSISAAN